MYFLGYDVGSSSIKACLYEPETGKVVASAASPQEELPMQSPRQGWAEQDPQLWWNHIQKATADLLEGAAPPVTDKIAGIGIAYQMHGLVMVDRRQQALHPAIIWCDGRAVDIGKEAFKTLGEEYCQQHYLNSPGNFTASKLRWIQQNKPEVYEKLHKIMLPGDYIAMKLTGRISTSLSGLSEGIFWDYKKGNIAKDLLDCYEISAELLPDYHPNFSVSGELTKNAAHQLGLNPGIPIGYRAGDQPNNALSLNVMQPGEVAANAGTSGVIYGVTDKPRYDEKSRVNTFLHVNHQEKKPHYGVLLCVNGTGIQNYWLKSHLFGNEHSYDNMNRQAGKIPIGSDGLCVFPFGNGPERVLQHQQVGAQIRNIRFNQHSQAHVMRAGQEGICFSLNYGLNVMKGMGMEVNTIRVGSDNMFQSPVFREAFVNVTGTAVEVLDTNGALGAAIGAAIGMDHFRSREEAFKNIDKIRTLHPEPVKQKAYRRAYERWEATLQRELSSIDS